MTKATIDNPRKATRFDWCPAHRWLRFERRTRQAEFAAEGGPTTPCTPGRPCRVYAGTDLFIPSVCHGEYVSLFGSWDR